MWRDAAAAISTKKTKNLYAHSLEQDQCSVLQRQWPHYIYRVQSCKKSNLAVHQLIISAPSEPFNINNPMYMVYIAQRYKAIGLYMHVARIVHKFIASDFKLLRVLLWDIEQWTVYSAAYVHSAHVPRCFVISPQGSRPYIYCCSSTSASELEGNQELYRAAG